MRHRYGFLKRWVERKEINSRYQIYSEGLETPKLTASFLDFLLEEELGVDLWWDILWPWEAASTWKEDAGWVIWEDFKEADELSCGITLVTLEDPGWLVWSGVAWELWASLLSKFFLFATLFLVTFKE